MRPTARPSRCSPEIRERAIQMDAHRRTSNGDRSIRSDRCAERANVADGRTIKRYRADRCWMTPARWGRGDRGAPFDRGPPACVSARSQSARPSGLVLQERKGAVAINERVVPRRLRRRPCALIGPVGCSISRRSAARRATHPPAQATRTATWTAPGRCGRSARQGRCRHFPIPRSRISYWAR